jgi:hypothetical protein
MTLLKTLGLATVLLFVNTSLGLAQTGSGGTGTGGGASGKGGTQQSQEMMHQERMKEQQEGKHSPQGLSSSTREEEAGVMPQKSREEKERERGKKGK